MFLVAAFIALAGAGPVHADPAQAGTTETGGELRSDTRSDGSGPAPVTISVALPTGAQYGDTVPLHWTLQREGRQLCIAASVEGLRGYLEAEAERLEDSTWVGGTVFAFLSTALLVAPHAFVTGWLFGMSSTLGAAGVLAGLYEGELVEESVTRVDRVAGQIAPVRPVEFAPGCGAWHPSLPGWQLEECPVHELREGHVRTLVDALVATGTSCSD